MNALPHKRFSWLRPVCIYFIVLMILAGCASRPTVELQANEEPEPVSQVVEPTVVVPTNTPQPTATEVPPTSTPAPTDTPVPPTSTSTPEPTDTPVPPTPTPDIEAAMAEMKILVFEDMFFSRFVKEALDESQYTYTDAGDAIGRFKNELLSDTEWDLVIAAAEGRGGVTGEFFDYIQEQLDKGASVILEMWILNYVADGRIKATLEECGIEYQGNWTTPPDRAVYWSDPDHPLVNEPFQVSLDRFTNFWVGDVGDLVSKTRGSEAEIIGSANGPNADSDGLVVVCYDGRLILQTFSTHDHRQADMVDLWSNYIYYALKNRVLKGMD